MQYSSCYSLLGHDSPIWSTQKVSHQPALKSERVSQEKEEEKEQKEEEEGEKEREDEDEEETKKSFIKMR